MPSDSHPAVTPAPRFDPASGTRTVTGPRGLLRAPDVTSGCGGRVESTLSIAIFFERAVVIFFMPPDSWAPPSAGPTVCRDHAQPQ